MPFTGTHRRHRQIEKTQFSVWLPQDSSADQQSARIKPDEDQVIRVLEKHYRSHPDDNGPSWLAFIGHAKDSLWSIDYFRCESIFIQTHWVLVVMYQFTRHIVGFGMHAEDVDGVALCRMFSTAI
jgi:hypothetical protein